MSERLLVVEDSKAIALVIEQLAKSLGFEVVIASCFADLERILAESTDFFAATIDYGLPDAQNGEAIEYVLSHDIKGVVMTGRMDEATRKKILAQPVIDYIPKENSQAYLYLKRILHWQLLNRNNGILVVDDSLAARNHVVELLKRRNFAVYAASNGEKALQELEKHPDIKMVITDMEMPVMDGITLTNEIRRRYTRDQVAVIGISGANNGVHSARFIKNGADDFLRKPFCPEEFYCRVTQNIENLHNIEKIQRAANTDYLTDLPNRRSFIEKAEQVVNGFRKTNAFYGLAMLDIDFFKKVNDTYGHDAGDTVLKVVALYMRKHFADGMLARLGGEEFAIVLKGDDEEQIVHRLDDFCRELSVSTIPYENHQISTSVSIGVLFNGDGNLNSLMNQADQALYFAKENGRNQVAIANEMVH